MDAEERAGLLERLSAAVESNWEDIGADRKLFFRGLRCLQQGEIVDASRVFRRAARCCPAPFSTMAKMAHGRCEVVRGRQGAAVRTFRAVAVSDIPTGLKKMAWMELADVARERGDNALLQQARDAISKCEKRSKKS